MKDNCFTILCWFLPYIFAETDKFSKWNAGRSIFLPFQKRVFADCNISVTSSVFWIFSNTFQGRVPCLHEANYLSSPSGFFWGAGRGAGSWHCQISAIYILTRTLLPAPIWKGKSLLSKEVASQVGTRKAPLNSRPISWNAFLSRLIWIVWQSKHSDPECLPKIYDQ